MLCACCKASCDLIVRRSNCIKVQILAESFPSREVGGPIVCPKETKKTERRSQILVTANRTPGWRKTRTGPEKALLITHVPYSSVSIRGSITSTDKVADHSQLLFASNRVGFGELVPFDVQTRCLQLTDLGSNR